MAYNSKIEDLCNSVDTTLLQEAIHHINSNCLIIKNHIQNVLESGLDKQSGDICDGIFNNLMERKKIICVGYSNVRNFAQHLQAWVSEKVPDVILEVYSFEEIQEGKLQVSELTCEDAVLCDVSRKLYVPRIPGNDNSFHDVLYNLNALDTIVSDMRAITVHNQVVPIYLLPISPRYWMDRCCQRHMSYYHSPPDQFGICEIILQIERKLHYVYSRTNVSLALSNFNLISRDPSKLMEHYSRNMVDNFHYTKRHCRFLTLQIVERLGLKKIV